MYNDDFPAKVLTKIGSQYGNPKNIYNYVYLHIPIILIFPTMYHTIDLNVMHVSENN